MDNRKTYQKPRDLVYYILFVINPFLSLFLAFINLSNKAIRNILFLFCGFFGYSFIISSPRIDSDRYRIKLERFHDSHLDLLVFFKGIFSGDIGSGDYYNLISTFLVSRVTDDYRILFMVFGLVFGYFLSKSLYIVLKVIKRQYILLLIPLIFLFLLANPIWNINGVRFYTAAQVFIYGALSYFYCQKKSGILWVSFSVFFHFTFLFPVGIFLMSILITGNKFFFYLGVLFLILIINLNPLDYLHLLSGIEGHAGDKIFRYTHPQYLDQISKQQLSEAWFLTYSRFAINLVMGLIILLLLPQYKQLCKVKANRLFALGVFLFLFTLFLENIPSMSRFYILSYMLLSVSSIIYICKVGKVYWFNRLMPFMVIGIGFFIVIQVRLGMEVFGPTLFISNPLLQPFLEGMPTFYK